MQIVEHQQATLYICIYLLTTDMLYPLSEVLLKMIFLFPRWDMLVPHMSTWICISTVAWPPSTGHGQLDVAEADGNSLDRILGFPYCWRHIRNQSPLRLGFPGTFRHQQIACFECSRERGDKITPGFFVRVNPSIHQEISFETFQSNTGWLVFKDFCKCSPRKVGEDEPILTNAYFSGWGVGSTTNQKNFSQFPSYKSSFFSIKCFFWSGFLFAGFEPDFYYFESGSDHFFSQGQENPSKQLLYVDVGLRADPRVEFLFFSKIFHSDLRCNYIWYIYIYGVSWKSEETCCTCKSGATEE